MESHDRLCPKRYGIKKWKKKWWMSINVCMIFFKHPSYKWRHRANSIYWLLFFLLKYVSRYLFWLHLVSSFLKNISQIIIYYYSNFIWRYFIYVGFLCDEQLDFSCPHKILNTHWNTRAHTNTQEYIVHTRVSAFDDYAFRTLTPIWNYLASEKEIVRF